MKSYPVTHTYLLITLFSPLSLRWVSSPIVPDVGSRSGHLPHWIPLGTPRIHLQTTTWTNQFSYTMWNKATYKVSTFLYKVIQPLSPLAKKRENMIRTKAKNRRLKIIWSSRLIHLSDFLASLIGLTCIHKVEEEYSRETAEVECTLIIF